MQIGQERGAGVDDSVTVLVAQQRDAIGARNDAACLFLIMRHEPAAHAAVGIGPLGRIGFGHEYVAIGQHVQPSWMIQSGRKRRNRGAVVSDRSLSFPPPHGINDVDRRHQ